VPSSTAPKVAEHTHAAMRRICRTHYHREGRKTSRREGLRRLERQRKHPDVREERHSPGRQPVCLAVLGALLPWSCCPSWVGTWWHRGIVEIKGRDRCVRYGDVHMQVIWSHIVDSHCRLTLWTRIVDSHYGLTLWTHTRVYVDASMRTHLQRQRHIQAPTRAHKV
jgi:hypothetical protein